ncbi:hypothetical protein QQX98_003107 [Neonectria punicea]|uniref:C2H2-type domain-containing protein n=1 Tax=Neonectria punicea TaxID=979145 RepID=A0ABR1HFN3_9HYPO
MALLRIQPHCDKCKKAETAADSSATKRRRSGRPVSSVQPSSSDSDSNDSCSSGGSGSDQDGYTPDFDESEREASPAHIWDQDVELQTSTSLLVPLAYSKAKSWITSSHFAAAPPRDRGSPRKRSRTATRRHRSRCLACPIYASNPGKYRLCLLHHDLQSIEDVIVHVRRHHTQSPYCPMCYRTFDRVLERNDHILARTCELRDSGDIEGINEYQKIRLSRRDKVHLSEKKGWLRLWDIVFPKTECIRSPYLESDAFEREVVLFREYWKRHGRGIIARYLESQDLLCGNQVDEERRRIALYKSTLEGLLSKVAEEHQGP